MIIKTAKELTVYQKSYELAMQIFEISQSFPREELSELNSEIGKMLGKMITNPSSFLISN